MQGERWVEKFKEEDDYWERKGEKYTEYRVAAKEGSGGA